MNPHKIPQKLVLHVIQRRPSAAHLSFPVPALLGRADAALRYSEHFATSSSLDRGNGRPHHWQRGKPTAQARCCGSSDESSLRPRLTEIHNFLLACLGPHGIASSPGASRASPLFFSVSRQPVWRHDQSSCCHTRDIAFPPHATSSIVHSKRNKGRQTPAGRCASALIRRGDSIPAGMRALGSQGCRIITLWSVEIGSCVGSSAPRAATMRMYGPCLQGRRVADDRCHQCEMVAHTPRRRPPAEGFGARRAQKNTGAEVLARPRMLADALGRDTGGLAGAADAGAAAAELCETGVEEVEKNMASGCKCRRVRGVAMIWAMRLWGGSTVCGGGGGEGGEALWPGAHWVVGLRDLESCRRKRHEETRCWEGRAIDAYTDHMWIRHDNSTSALCVNREQRLEETSYIDCAASARANKLVNESLHLGVSLTPSSINARGSAVRNPRQCGYTANAVGTEDSCIPPGDPRTHPEPWPTPALGSKKTHILDATERNASPASVYGGCPMSISRPTSKSNERPNSRDGAYTRTRSREYPDRSLDFVLRTGSIPASARRGARIACNTQYAQSVRGRRHVGTDCEGNQAKEAFHSVRDAAKAASRRRITYKRPWRAS
ncbi:predicted protein [Postia placenta Mad-698-R]|nr:predicted protein [Postia placenta Mad-698-R]